MGSEKPKKEQLAKGKAAKMNASGGKAGKEDRKGGKAGHSKLICPLCMAQAHDITAMKIHHDAKHPAVAWDETKYEDLHAKHGGSTQGVGVKGSITAAKGNRH